MRSLLDTLGPDAATAIQNALQQGVALGRNPRAVASALAKQVDIAGARLLRITRTEILNSYRSATLRQYAANADILDGWRWTCSHGDRTCAACLSLDNRLFPLTVEFMPTHVSCRCSPRPALKGVDDQVGETGAEWFARQPASVQDKVLGQQAGAAYRAGEVSLDDFAVLHRDARWGDRYRRGSLVEARVSAQTRAAGGTGGGGGGARKAPPSNDDVHPNNPAVRRSADGVWGEDILPVTGWENARERVVLPLDLQEALGLPDSVLRWNAEKHRDVLSIHQEVRTLSVSVSELLAHWEFAGKEPTKRGLNTLNVVMRRDGERWIAVISDRQWRTNQEGRHVMVTVFRPRETWLNQRIADGIRRGLDWWIRRE